MRSPDGYPDNPEGRSLRDQFVFDTDRIENKPDQMVRFTRSSCQHL